MASKTSPESQRALVLQGGGALGAYDAGVLKALCEKIHEIDGNDVKRKINVFDVIAGTSSGAINASIVLGHISHKIENGGGNVDFAGIWDDAVYRLYQFWKHTSTMSEAEKDSTFDERWKTYRKFNPSAASPEAARRWYAAGQFLLYGADNMFTAPTEIADNKYFDRLNTWYRYDNSPLKKSIKDYGKFPVASSFDNEEPRLLVVGVDVKEGLPVTFDSYEKAANKRYSEYGKEEDSTHVIIRYDEGITEDHVMASASVPVNYDYTRLKEEDTNKTQCFWDGGWLSNTPLRELISEHQSFWTKRIGDTKLEDDMWKTEGGSGENVMKVPDLSVYIVNVWPTKIDTVPEDRDRIAERANDMIFSDKTEYDEKVALLVTDYINLVKRMRQIGSENAKDKDAFNARLGELMDLFAKSAERTGKSRKNKDLIKGRFSVRVHRIQLAEDEDSTSRKFFDYSRQTIEELMERGYNDGREQFKDIFTTEQEQ